MARFASRIALLLSLASLLLCSACSKDEKKEEQKGEQKQPAANQDNQAARAKNHINAAHGANAKSDIRQLEQACEMYYIENMQPPKSLRELQDKGYIPRALMDPWGHPYRLWTGKETFIYSIGPDGVDDTDDDIEGVTLFR